MRPKGRILSSTLTGVETEAQTGGMTSPKVTLLPGSSVWT